MGKNKKKKPVDQLYPKIIALDDISSNLFLTYHRIQQHDKKISEEDIACVNRLIDIMESCDTLTMVKDVALLMVNRIEAICKDYTEEAPDRNVNSLELIRRLQHKERVYSKLLLMVDEVLFEINQLWSDKPIPKGITEWLKDIEKIDNYGDLFVNIDDLQKLVDEYFPLLCPSTEQEA